MFMKLEIKIIIFVKKLSQEIFIDILLDGYLKSLEYFFFEETNKVTDHISKNSYLF